MLVKRCKKGQVTIFVIVAILIVALVSSYFIFRNNVAKNVIPGDFEEVHNSYLSCLEEQTSLGVSLLGSQGGYISLPDFEQGSRYMPFSNYLSFGGLEIPYWYYISGNNLPRQQVPSLEDMEADLEKFILEISNECKKNSYYPSEYEVLVRDLTDSKVVIEKNQVKVEVISDFSVSKDYQSYLFEEHSFKIDSKLGELYESAVDLYEQEMEEMFLENYTFDVLALYAPLDGVELSCKPLVWDAGEVIQNLSEAISANILALKSEGKNSDYFVIDSNIKNSFRFLSNPEWTSAYEIAPSEGSLLVADPIGTQQGMGIIGFCYVPYHFVYDIRYPVLIQVYEGNEIFQFPFVVIIDNNVPRKGHSPIEPLSIEQESICDNPGVNATLSLYDSKLRAINGEIFYDCFGSRCNLGETEFGELTTFVPQCYNGVFSVRSEGYADYTLVKPGLVIEGEQILMILDKEFTLDLEILSSGDSEFDQAIVNFISGEGKTSTIVYPDQKEIILSEGEYELSVQAYGAAEIEFNTTYEQCVEGFFFGIGKKCYEVEMPSESFNRALVGGGVGEIILTENQLEDSRKISLDLGELNPPENLNELQSNYILIESRELGVELN